MRLSGVLILIYLFCSGVVYAQTAPASTVSQKTPAACPKTCPHPVHVGPVNGPLKRDGTVNMTYKARKEAQKNSTPPPPRPAPKKTEPTVTVITQ